MYGYICSGKYTGPMTDESEAYFKPLIDGGSRCVGSCSQLITDFSRPLLRAFVGHPPPSAGS
jgi:hypothetical protein